ncbi:MAG: DNA primase large subunit PriL, partial [Thermoplasmata archaeon]|nr:DNA primase large subunit PriL [Thermoplasmata archaeon]
MTDIAYETSRTRGKERVREAIEEGKVSSVPLAKEMDQLKEMLSYPIARMLVSCTGDRYLISRYALGEAMLLESRLAEEDIDLVVENAKELGLEVEQDGSRRLMIHFGSFLSATSSIRAKEWKLVNQEIFNGMVKVSKERLARIIRQLLYDKINAELPRPVNDKILSVFKKDAEIFSMQLESKRKEYVSGELGPIDDASFPPCMRTILTMTRAGENVPHTARFAITAFLHTLGMDASRIIEMFSTAPDFDVGKSEYQVRHISGEISGTEYTPPECATM